MVPATIVLMPARGIAGGAFTARGNVAAGAAGVRILWNDGIMLRGLAEGSVGADGSYRLTVKVPHDVESGEVHVCAAASGAGATGDDLGCAPFTVLPTPPGSILGTITDTRGLPVVGADVRLTTDDGAPVATTATDDSGGYSFTDLSPGGYVVDARCPAGGGSGCAPSTIYFPPAMVSVAPGAIASEPFTPLPPPADAAALSGFGGIALPGGALTASGPVRVTSGLTGVIAHLGSLQGHGLAPLTIRFWADVEFFDGLSRAKAVRFQILQGSAIVASKMSSAPQPVFSADPIYAFSSYVADFNVSELPPGDLTLRITPFLGGFSTTRREFTIRMTDLGGRWFNDWITDPAVDIAVGGADDLLYKFTGILPSPAFDFDKPIHLPFDTTLDNKVLLGIPIEETLHTNQTWSGTAKASAQVTFLSKDFLNEMRTYNGPSGTSFVGSTYALDTIHKDLFGKQCVPIPQLSYCIGYEVDPGPFIPNISVGIWFSTKICVQGFIDLDSTIKDDLRVNARMTPGSTVSVPVELKVGAAVCSGSAKAEPSATATLPIYYDPDRDPLFGFDNPCLRLTAALDYKVKCVGITVTKGSAGLGELKFGCSTSALLTPLAQQTAGFTIGEQSPSPSVATDGGGHAIAIWIQEESVDPNNSDRRLYFSYYDSGTWTAPARVSDQRALVDEPKIVLLASQRALAVWVQNRLTQEQALASDQATLLSNSELFFAEWDGTTWSAPAPLTNDAVFDTSPSLAADPSNGTAVLAWLRAHENVASGTQPFGVYAARFDGALWSAPVSVDPPSATLDHPPTIKFDRHGQPVALWLRDTDGNFLTSEDRQIVMSRFEQGAWSALEVIPNLPPGPYTPSLAFDTNNNPIVVFVVPPVDVETGRRGSGDGNSSVLYAAYRRHNLWEVGAVGQDVHAERPVVGVNSDNHAVIMYRQFGDTGDVHVSGDLASAVADLGADPLKWTNGFLTADGQVNWEVAFDIDAATADNFVFDVKKPNAAAAGLLSAPIVGGHVAANAIATGDASVTSMVVPYQPDLTVAPADITFSNPHPLIGDRITITANVRNIGLRSVGDVTFTNVPGSNPTVLPLRDGRFTVGLYDGDRLIGRFDVLASALPFNTSIPIPFMYTVPSGGLHTIRIVADEADDVVESIESNNTAQTMLGDVPPPRNPSTLIDASKGALTVRWDAPETSGISGYRVYRSVRSGGGYELVGGATDTSFVDELAKPATTYYYVVAAVDVYGLISSFSSEVHGTIVTRVCVGDCDLGGFVTVDELLVGVNIALGSLPVERCATFDVDGDGNVTVDEILTAVNNALNRCPA